MIIIDGLLIILLIIGQYLGNFLKKKNWSNPFLNIFYILNMIFSSPFNVMFGVFTSSFIGIILALYQFDITNSSNMNIKLIDPPIATTITLSITTIVLFIILTIFSGLTAYYIWAHDERKIKGYKSLLEFSKIFTFRIPLLIITLGLCLPNFREGEVTSLSYWMMIHGLYVVPIFMLVIKKTSLGENNGRSKN
ncbi:hypothetical protein CRU99_12725 [Malaciobacter mytili]|uniref:hypothetical protein n=1 Tax=Malaciobacter mytili TaxID=603050 RepID=UPI00100AD0C6|nr:hypothetical protein [Malaciobacter mytili]RXI37036.1 hypothetical protein CRU99_12725 [Malaciobacter mytili]